jgi:hypothetical protein
MGNQGAYAVPKHRQNVTVHLDAAVSVAGSIFLESAPGANTVHHRVVAFLEDETMFFPLTLQGGGATEFIRKRNIRMVEANYGEDEEIQTALNLMQRVNITAVFTDDSSINGEVMADVPAEKARLSDCLNVPSHFLIVKVSDSICYVNKYALRKVVYNAKT